MTDKTPSPLAEKYVTNYIADVEKYPDCFKPHVVADPRAAALSVIHGLSDDDVAIFIKDQADEAKLLAKSGY